MDFKLYEQGDGGELNLIGGDIESDKTLSNAIYLSLFSTDTWYDIFEDGDGGNSNSANLDNDNNNLEIQLKELIISTANIRKLETLINEKLNWLLEENIVDSIDTTITPTFETIKICITIQEPSNVSKKYLIIWSNQKIILKENYSSELN
jgi:phage gp46-like protein